ncbi:MAG: hypothetical protein IKW90_17425 [Lachnospiraceae bacterium]|nr:hypothetical protein [Lachnospiraceae bacterium]
MFRTILLYKNRIIAEGIGATEEDSVLEAKVIAEKKGYDVDALEKETERLCY